MNEERSHNSIILSLPVLTKRTTKGSFAPNTEAKPIYEKKFEPDEAPSGMLARGHYEAVSRFVDDDGHDFLLFEWSFDIAKDWK